MRHEGQAWTVGLPAIFLLLQQVTFSAVLGHSVKQEAQYMGGLSLMLL